MENKNKFWKYGISSIITLIFIPILYYALFPPINIKSADFWSFIFLCIVVFFVSIFLLSGKFKKKARVEVEEEKNVQIKVGKKVVTINRRILALKRFKKVFIALLIIAAVIFLAIWVSSSEIFHAKKYHEQLQVSNGNFQEDIAEIPFSQIPVVDKATAKKLGDRKLGEVVSLVSQFDISDLYTQINYNNTPTRVSPLVYSDLIKWFTNQSQGIPYYVSINMATQETQLVQLQEAMKYGQSEHFNRYIMRHVQMNYPMDLLENPVFEIDESGKPYWIVPVYDYEIGFLGGKNITSVIVVDAVNGNLTKYNIQDVPQWIDNVYPASLLNYQANNWGKYSNGWFNSIFGQRDVITTTEGYNSLAINDDLWMYTGLTSVNSDQSNVGFILVNMRTKETKYYKINGADEESAMHSAEGKVQEKQYNATFPILINVANQPTYFMSLKDSAGLIKQYAFVSVESYQIVGVGDSVKSAQESYVQQLQTNGALNNGQEEKPTNDVTGSIVQIASAVVDSNTLYYITLDQQPGAVFIAPISISNRLPLLQAGQKVNLTVTQTGEDVYSVRELKLV